MADSTQQSLTIKVNNYKIPFALKDYFEYGRTTDKSVILKCLKCNAEISGKLNDIFNFRRHLKLKHQVETVQKPALATSTVLDHFSKPKKKTVPTDYNSISNKMFRQSVLDLISLDGHPISVVEGLGFQNFVSTMIPSVSCPSRRTVKRHLDEEFQSKVLPNITQHLCDLPKKSVHLTLDLWTGRSQESIMGVNVVYISTSWRLHRRCLSFSAFPEQHTGINIEAKLRCILESRGLDLSQVGKVMADNASNIVAAFNLTSILTGAWTLQHLEPAEDVDSLEDDLTSEGVVGEEVEGCLPIQHYWERLGCCAHTLQLCVKSALKDDTAAKHALDLVNKVTLHFRRAGKLNGMLKEKCKKGLILPGKTRWNSILHSLRRLLKDDVYSAISQILLDHPMPSTSSGFNGLSEGIRPQLEELETLLGPMNIATNRLQANSITGSLMIPTILEAYSDIQTITTSFYPTLQRSLLSELGRRFGRWIKEPVYIAASILDPRQKTRVFKTLITADELQIPDVNEAIDVFKHLFDATDDNTVTNDIQILESSSSHPPAQHISKKRKKNNIFDFLDGVSPPIQTSKSELDLYLEEGVIKGSDDPLVFWKNNENRFPRLATMARFYLSVPASSGDVERLFSIAGSLQRTRRSSLRPDTLEQMLLYRDFRFPILFSNQ